MSIAALVAWLAATRLSWVVNHYAWIWPAAQTLHFIGLALLLGNVGLLDLRLLGVAKELPVEPINRLIPFGVAGFLLNAFTGTLFVFGEPKQYLPNPAFQLKILFIALAGLNVLVFSFSETRLVVAGLGPGKDAPRKAKIIAAMSLFLWVGVVYWGRMLPYIGDAF
jgi:hypothetical protein